MQYVRLPAALMLLMASGTILADAEWVLVGESGLGPWQIYVDAESRKTDFDGNVHVAVLDDHRVTQEGVDRVDSSGDVYYDTHFKYRSAISDIVFDCEHSREVLLRVRYYAGDMGTGAVVLDEEESEPAWSNVLFMIEERLTKYVCSMGG